MDVTKDEIDMIFVAMDKKSIGSIKIEEFMKMLEWNDFYFLT